MSPDDVVSGPKWVLGGFLFFKLWDQLLRSVVPRTASATVTQAWKWKNTAVSFVHSLLTGPWSLYCFYEHPKLGEDLSNTYTVSSHRLVSFSVGYFIHDFLDMALWHRKRSSYELMAHHICVISCFGMAVWTSTVLGYAVMALFVEVNSVFLHTRQLLRLIGVDKEQPMYRINSMLNIGTFVVFRIAVLGWMTRWLVFQKDNLTLPMYTLGSVALAVIVFMNIILFHRICTVDFSKKKHKDSKVSAIHKKILQEDEDVTGVGVTSSSLIPNGNNLHLS